MLLTSVVTSYSNRAVFLVSMSIKIAIASNKSDRQFDLDIQS